MIFLKPAALSINPAESELQSVLAKVFSIQLLVSILFIATGCHRKDPIYSQNRELIRIMDAQDKKTGVASDRYVVYGGMGHLFYLEDLRAAIIKWNELDKDIRIIFELSNHLKSKNIRLFIVPVPSKVETYPELLGGRNVFDMSPSKNIFFRRLDSLGLDYVDLRADFFRVKYEKHLYPHTDTHWDEDAICLAAEKIADKIHVETKSRNELPITDTMLIGFQGDLAEKFKVAGSDTIRLKVVGDGKGGRYAEPDSSAILLFGDSFSGQYKKYSAHLGAHLARNTGTPVKTIYSLTGFTQGPEKINELIAAFPEIKTIIWVFSSRTLMESLIRY